MPIVDTVSKSSSTTPHAKPIEASSSGTSDAASVVSVMDSVRTSWQERVQDLKTQTQRLREDRQRVAKDLKAAQRKNRRLKERARCLSEDDMMSILLMKRMKPTAATSNTKAASSSSTGDSSDATTLVLAEPCPSVEGTLAVGEGQRAESDVEDMRTDE